MIRRLRCRRAVAAAIRAAAGRGEKIYPSRLRLIREAARQECGMSPGRSERGAHAAARQPPG